MAVQLAWSAYGSSLKSEIVAPLAPPPADQDAPFRVSTQDLQNDGENVLHRVALSGGDVVALRIGFQRCHLAAHPDAVEQVLDTNKANYTRLRRHSALAEIFGEPTRQSRHSHQWTSQHSRQAISKQRDAGRRIKRLDEGIAEAVQHWTAHAGVGDFESDLHAVVRRAMAASKGAEAIAATLSRTFQRLAEYPGIQDRLRLALLETIPLDRTPTRRALESSDYARAVLDETVRLNPASPWFACKAIGDDVVMGHRVKAGEMILISPVVMNRLPAFWPHGECFDPDCFLETAATSRFARISGVHGWDSAGRLPHEDMMVLILARVLAYATLQIEPGEAVTDQTDRPSVSHLRIKPLVRRLTIHGKAPGEHAILDAAMRLRKRVFIDIKGWPLPADDQGREIDQFDSPDTFYFNVLSNGRVVGSARAIPLDKPSLLMDVFPWLIEGERGHLLSSDLWEGARLVVDPTLSARESRQIVAALLAEAVQKAISDGVEAILTVSDPILERVLKRLGTEPTRLGPVQADPHGFDVVGLRIECTQRILNNLIGKSQPPAEAPTEPKEVRHAA